MPAWIYPKSVSQAGAVVSLAPNENVYVGSGVSIATTAAGGVTISAGADHNQAWIDGSVAGSFAIHMGEMTTTSSDYRVVISDSGKLFATTAAIRIVAYGSEIENDGYIASTGYGIELGGANAGTLSSIHNSGTIRADSIAIHKFSGGESLFVENSGVIRGGDLSFYAQGSGSSTILNTGTMTGQIILGSGDDSYDGRKGVLQGPLVAGSGNDALQLGSGADQVQGDAGADRITGGQGADLIDGGADADTFVFTSIRDSTVRSTGRDTIRDFSHAENDVIDLHAIDANTRSGGNQAFDFIGKQGFTHTPGELRFVKHGADSFIIADVNGDGKADFEIHFEGLAKFVEGDFLL